jgi:hypothetical protein
MRLIGLVLAFGLTVLPLVAEGQSAGKIPRLCFLTFDPGTPQSPSPRFEAFFAGLRDAGYVHGKTITIDYLVADGRSEKFPVLAAECVRLKADIIVVSTTPAAHAAKNATRTIPIVMVALGDPVGTGLVESLARPGGNVTGMSQMTSGLAAKRLEVLKETVPRISRVLVLSYLVDPIAPLQVTALKEAAPTLGVTLLIHDIRTADDLPAAFEAGVREHAEGLLVARFRSCRGLSAHSRTEIGVSHGCVQRKSAQAQKPPPPSVDEPPCAPKLTLQRERSLELGPDLRPRLRAPARLQHHVQHAVDAEPGCQRRASVSRSSFISSSARATAPR